MLSINHHWTVDSWQLEYGQWSPPRVVNDRVSVPWCWSDVRLRVLGEAMADENEEGEEKSEACSTK